MEMNKNSGEVCQAVMAAISNLKYEGVNTDAFFDESPEVDREVYNQVLWEASGNIEAQIILEVEHGLKGYFGYLAYRIIRENAEEKAEELVKECLDDLFFNK